MLLKCKYTIFLGKLWKSRRIIRESRFETGDWISKVRNSRFNICKFERFGHSISETTNHELMTANEISFNKISHRKYLQIQHLNWCKLSSAINPKWMSICTLNISLKNIIRTNWSEDDDGKSPLDIQLAKTIVKISSIETTVMVSR